MVSRLRNPLVWGPISVALLVLVIWRSGLLESGASLSSTRPAPLLAAAALSVLAPLLWGLRSAGLLAASGHHVTVAAMIPLAAFANTINNLTPGSVGELGRLYLLRAYHAVDYATGGAVILIERIVSIGYLGGSALIAWIAVRQAVPTPLAVAALVVLVAIPGVAYRLGMHPVAWFIAAPLRRIGGDRWPGAIAGLLAADHRIGRLLTDPLTLGRFALLSGAVYLVAAVQLVLVANAFGVELGVLAAWGALGLSILAGVVSLLPFGLGVADLALATLLVAQGVEAPQAAAITVAYRLVSTLPTALIGVASYVWLSARLPAGGLDDAASAARTGLAAVAAGDPDRP